MYKENIIKIEKVGPSQFRQASDPTSALEFLHWRKLYFLQDRRDCETSVRLGSP